MIKCYHKAKKNKSWRANTIQFSLQAERNCFKLARGIINRDYQIKASLCFLSFSPVKREIFAGDFSDRVVHHYLFSKLNKHYDKLLINDCYSCRKNKGTSYGIERLAKFLRQASDNYQNTSYVMKLDISGYFMNIDQKKLYNLNKKLVKRFYKADPAKKNEILYLLSKVIFNDPTKNCRLKGNKSDWKGLPKNKSLFFALPAKGLPIGNLTSQLFGNIYLNEFDHFVKEKLKCPYYGRYVDDMVFVHQDKEYLKNLIPKIDNYLKDNLDLKLHPKKIYIQNIDKGVPFLGMIIKPYHIYPGKRIRQNFYSCLKDAIKSKSGIDNINSYLGMIKNYNSYRLRKKYLESEVGQKALIALNARVNKDYTKIKPNY